MLGFRFETSNEVVSAGARQDNHDQLLGFDKEFVHIQLLVRGKWNAKLVAQSQTNLKIDPLVKIAKIV